MFENANFFQLAKRPFAAAPDSQWFFPSSSADQALQALQGCLDREQGTGLLIGRAGMGKSLVCQLLAHRQQQQVQSVVLTSSQTDSRRALLQNILFELDLPFRDLEEGELRLTLMDYLTPRGGPIESLLLIVDEAHGLQLPLQRVRIARRDPGHVLQRLEPGQPELMGAPISFDGERPPIRRFAPTLGQHNDEIKG